MNLYVYRYSRTELLYWEPLEWAAERSAKLKGAPTIDPAPFMYMGRLVSREGQPDLHLYKHYETRRYLNVDEAHRVYVFMWGSDGDTPFFETDVYYGRLRGLAQALDLLDLHLCSRSSGLDNDDDKTTANNVVPIWSGRRSPGRPTSGSPA